MRQSLCCYAFSLFVALIPSQPVPGSAENVCTDEQQESADEEGNHDGVERIDDEYEWIVFQ